MKEYVKDSPNPRPVKETITNLERAYVCNQTNVMLAEIQGMEARMESKIQARARWF